MNTSYPLPNVVNLVTSKQVKLYLGPCKVVQTLAGKLCLVSPLFGAGYFGSFRGTDFYPGRDCKQEYIDLLQRVEEHGLDAVMQIGQLTGICGICGRELTDETSIAMGIGPICAGRMQVSYPKPGSRNSTESADL